METSLAPCIPPALLPDESLPTAEDRRYLKTFRALSIRLLSDLDLPFVRGILRRSVSSPAIRHAALALSAELEVFARRVGNNGTNQALPSDQYSLRQYGKSLQSISQQLSSWEANRAAQAVEVLTAVFLLICYELLRGHDAESNIHLTGAMKGLASVPAEDAGSDRPELAELRGLYTRLEVYALSYLGGVGIGKPVLRTPLVPWAVLGPPFVSPIVNEAAVEALRGSLTNLAYRFFQFAPLSTPFATKIPRAPPSETRDPITAAERDVMLYDLGQWELEFWALVSEMGNSGDMPSHFRRECLALRLRQRYLHIYISTCLGTAGDTLYDDFQPQFVDIVFCADAILRMRGDVAALWTIETTVIEPLYFTTLKCREPQTRETALALLRSSGQEGVWDGRVMARIAERVISLENELSGQGAWPARVCEVTTEFDHAKRSVWVTSEISTSPDPGTARSEWREKLLYEAAEES